MRFLSQLNEKQIEHIQAETHALWGDGAKLNDRIAKLQRLLAFGPEQLRLCGLEVDGKLVSSLKRYRLTFRTPGGPLPAIGLGAVFTPEDERKKGYAAHLIRLVLDEAKRDGVEAALLYSDIGAEYYEQFGFRAIPLNRAMVKAETKPYSIKVRDSLPTENHKLLKFRNDHCSETGIHVAYDENNWGLFRAWSHDEPPKIVMRNGQEIGYVSYGSGKSMFGVTELWVPQYAIDEIWTYLSTTARERAFYEIRAWLHPSVTPKKTEWIPVEKPQPMIAFLSCANFPLESVSLNMFDYF